jgi:hypothetical protein
MGLNFEQVWAALMENRQQMKETQQETDRQLKELQKSMGYLSNRFGELAICVYLNSWQNSFHLIN